MWRVLIYWNVEEARQAYDTLFRSPTPGLHPTRRQVKDHWVSWRHC